MKEKNYEFSLSPTGQVKKVIAESLVEIAIFCQWVGLGVVPSCFDSTGGYRQRYG